MKTFSDLFDELNPSRMYKYWIADVQKFLNVQLVHPYHVEVTPEQEAIIAANDKLNGRVKQ